MLYLLFVFWHLSGQPDQFSVQGYLSKEACEQARVAHKNEGAPILRKVMNEREVCVGPRSPADDPCAALSAIARRAAIDWQVTRHGEFELPKANPEYQAARKACSDSNGGLELVWPN